MQNFPSSCQCPICGQLHRLPHSLPELPVCLHLLTLGHSNSFHRASKDGVWSKTVSRVPTTQSTSNFQARGWFTSATLLAHDSISHTGLLFCLQIYHTQSYTGQSALFLQCSSLVTWPTPLCPCPQSDLKVSAPEDPIWGISLRPTQSIPIHLYWFLS